MKPTCSSEPNSIRKSTKLQRPRLGLAEATNKESETKRKGEGFGQDALCLSQRERDEGQREERRVNLKKWWDGQLLNIQDSTTKHLDVRRGQEKRRESERQQVIRVKVWLKSWDVSFSKKIKHL